ncbi:hypothetical protein CRE_26005 [Caenorhabditis remanei]|uniref:Uncharacterized protein n=1 Tax=Caenorhabditis remanei TaxID=31234 RepID=E3NSB3_CAERE|nr:hypothetical protein CRE_26005 [Caenorhabditis remanei]
MYLFLFLFSFPFLANYVKSDDNILMPFERFQYDLERFLPVMEQEVEFAELSSLTDDQAYEQIKTFFPTLQLRIQQLRNTGIIADTNRIKHKEGATQMCGQGHNFAYLLVDHKLRNINVVLNRKRISATVCPFFSSFSPTILSFQNNLKMLREIRDALIKWGISSKFPCQRAHAYKKG